MATAQFAQMGPIPHAIKTDLDMDTFFDFNQGTTTLNSPQPLASSSRSGPARPSQDVFINNAPSPYDAGDDRQVFAGPSHEYDRFKQQTGLPVGSVASFTALSQPISDSFAPSHAFGGFNSGIDEMAFDANLDASWATGLDMDADMNMDFNAPQPTPMFYSNSVQGRGRSNSEFVDPSSIGAQAEAQSNVSRVWPGMHQQQAQQAAMAKAQQQAQAQAHQQRMQYEAQQQHQRRMAAQQQQQQQHAQQSRSRASTYQNDPHTEESISRLLNQMRQNSAVPSNDDDDAGMLPHVARIRKEEEEMDEDERLLASEEGKKLSSKERRQLRNKVSARAFRSRRKGELLSQLLPTNPVLIPNLRIHWPARG